jgi:predicted MFS family arabinose efflux permease
MYFRNGSFIVWGLASLFYAYQYILRVLPNITMPEIMARFEIDAAVFGQISGIYYIGYAIMHIPIGIALDRIGPKIVMPFCILMTTIGLLPLVVSDVWIFPMIGRLLIGIGSSGAILGVFKITRMIFSQERFARSLGFAVTIGLCGAIYGGTPVKALLQRLGFDAVIFLLIALGALLAVGIYLLTPAIDKNETPASSIVQDLKSVLSNPLVISICILSGFMVGPLEGFADVWGVEFIRKAYPFDDSAASFLPSLIFLGMCFGCPFLSIAAEKTRAYLGIVALCALFMAIGFVAILRLDSNYVVLSTIFFIVGVMCAYQVLAIFKASTFVDKRLSGITTSLANMIIMAFGYLFHVSIGKSLVYFSYDHHYSNIAQYSKDAFLKSLSIIPVGLMIGFIGFSIIIIFTRRSKDVI